MWWVSSYDNLPFSQSGGVTSCFPNIACLIALKKIQKVAELDKTYYLRTGCGNRNMEKVWEVALDFKSRAEIRSLVNFPSPLPPLLFLVIKPEASQGFIKILCSLSRSYRECLINIRDVRAIWLKQLSPPWLPGLAGWYNSPSFLNFPSWVFFKILCVVKRRDFPQDQRSLFGYCRHLRGTVTNHPCLLGTLGAKTHGVPGKAGWTLY